MPKTPALRSALNRSMTSGHRECGGTDSPGRVDPLDTALMELTPNPKTMSRGKPVNPSTAGMPDCNGYSILSESAEPVTAAT
jgi:hypothetical protein